MVSVFEINGLEYKGQSAAIKDLRERGMTKNAAKQLIQTLEPYQRVEYRHKVGFRPTVMLIVIERKTDAAF